MHNQINKDQAQSFIKEVANRFILKSTIIVRVVKLWNLVVAMHGCIVPLSLPVSTYEHFPSRSELVAESSLQQLYVYKPVIFVLLAAVGSLGLFSSLHTCFPLTKNQRSACRLFACVLYRVGGTSKIACGSQGMHDGLSSPHGLRFSLVALPLEVCCHWRAGESYRHTRLHGESDRRETLRYEVRLKCSLSPFRKRFCEFPTLMLQVILVFSTAFILIRS